jgi:cellulose biosynthesis protein BcsQ
MASVAVYNSKGGIGKTTFAVNLAWESSRAGNRTLLWDVDGQGDSSWIMMAAGIIPKVDSTDFMHGTTDLQDKIRPTAIADLDILAADPALHQTDNFFSFFARQQRMHRLFAKLAETYDVVILDCPPGFGQTSKQALMFADLIVVPVVPAPLALRGLDRVRHFMMKNRGGHAPLLPVFSMVDRRRKLHKAGVAEHPDWPMIPMAGEIEQMTTRKLPIGAYAPNSAAVAAFNSVWKGVEQKLRKMWLIKTPIAPLHTVQMAHRASELMAVG